MVRFICIALFLIGGVAEAKRSYWHLTVTEPYLELHTAPGGGYPIFFVIERGESLTLLKRRVNWYKVEAENGTKGWVKQEQMVLTVDEDGNLFVPPIADERAYYDRNWEMGVMYGAFNGTNVISAYGGYILSPNLSLEVSASQVLGRFSENELAAVSVVHQLLPEKRFTPFFTLGSGIIRTKPKATLVQAVDREDQFALAGAGFRYYMSERFVIRFEYKGYVVLTSRDENEEIDEWKAGFTFFF